MPDHRVIAVGGRVHTPIIQIQPELQLGMLGKKGIECRPQMHAAERDRRRNAQGSRQAAAALGHVGSGLFDLAQDACRSFQERRPVLGETDLAGRAMQQACAQHSLDLGQPPADH